MSNLDLMRNLADQLCADLDGLIVNGGRGDVGTVADVPLDFMAKATLVGFSDTGATVELTLVPAYAHGSPTRVVTVTVADVPGRAH